MNKKYERVTINFKDGDLQILEELKKLAKKNRRSLSAEIQIILENKIIDIKKNFQILPMMN